MRLVFVSDTHQQHARLTQAIIAAHADVLVHCGDITGVGHPGMVGDFADWCSMLLRKKYVQHVVAIAGNHDVTFDETHPNIRGTSMPEVVRSLLQDGGVQYLQDSEITLFGKRFYGSPWTPAFGDGWGFQIASPTQDEEIAAKIPDGIDVLITHGPPYGILDRTMDGRLVGSKALRVRSESPGVHQPTIHTFGHIHGQYGLRMHQGGTTGGTLFINASTCTEQYKPTNPPIVVEV